jgi:hypothetical protein
MSASFRLVAELLKVWLASGVPLLERVLKGENNDFNNT